MSVQDQRELLDNLKKLKGITKTLDKKIGNTNKKIDGTVSKVNNLLTVTENSDNIKKLVGSQHNLMDHVMHSERAKKVMSYFDEEQQENIKEKYQQIQQGKDTKQKMNIAKNIAAEQYGSSKEYVTDVIDKAKKGEGLPELKQSVEKNLVKAEMIGKDMGVDIGGTSTQGKQLLSKIPGGFGGAPKKTSNAIKEEDDGLLPDSNGSKQNSYQNPKYLGQIQNKSPVQNEKPNSSENIIEKQQKQQQIMGRNIIPPAFAENKEISEKVQSKHLEESNNNLKFNAKDITQEQIFKNVQQNKKIFTPFTSPFSQNNNNNSNNNKNNSNNNTSIQLKKKNSMSSQKTQNNFQKNQSQHSTENQLDYQNLNGDGLLQFSDFSANNQMFSNKSFKEEVQQQTLKVDSEFEQSPSHQEDYKNNTQHFSLEKFDGDSGRDQLGKPEESSSRDDEDILTSNKNLNKKIAEDKKKKGEKKRKDKKNKTQKKEELVNTEEQQKINTLKNQQQEQAFELKNQIEENGLKKGLLNIVASNKPAIPDENNLSDEQRKIMDKEGDVYKKTKEMILMMKKAQNEVIKRKNAQKQYQKSEEVRDALARDDEEYKNSLFSDEDEEMDLEATDEEVKVLLFAAHGVVNKKEQLKDPEYVKALAQTMKNQSLAAIQNVAAASKNYLQTLGKKFEEDPEYKKKMRNARIVQFLTLILPTAIIFFSTSYQVIYARRLLKAAEDIYRDPQEKVEIVRRNNSFIGEVIEDMEIIISYDLFLIITSTIFNVYMYFFGCFQNYKKNQEQLQNFITNVEEKATRGTIKAVDSGDKIYRKSKFGQDQIQAITNDKQDKKIQKKNEINDIKDVESVRIDTDKKEGSEKTSVKKRITEPLKSGDRKSEINNQLKQSIRDIKESVKTSQIEQMKEITKKRVEEKTNRDIKMELIQVFFAIIMVCLIVAFIGQFIASLAYYTREYGFQEYRVFDGENPDGEIMNLDVLQLQKRQNHVIPNDIYGISEFIIWQPVYIIPIQGGVLLFVYLYVREQYLKGEKNKSQNVIMQQLMKQM